jgi:phosphoribosyl 1,2-cyclic phosphodiesterase
VEVALWGTRGSLASPGPDTVRYGGNTSCVSIFGRESPPIILDAGTGIRVLGQNIPPNINSFHILLTHLHMDHVQGLPFFAPLLRPGVTINIWGPASLTMNLESRIHRYVSPPLFPVRVRDLLSELRFHEFPNHDIEIGEFHITAQMILHPNPTVGYRIEDQNSCVTYLPDHEPALGISNFPRNGEWTSGYRLAEGSDLLIHDSQYTSEEYNSRYGFGHSSINHALIFAKLSEVKHLVPFHHDPAHGDDLIDSMVEKAMGEFQPDFDVSPGMEGMTFSFP